MGGDEGVCDKVGSILPEHTHRHYDKHIVIIMLTFSLGHSSPGIYHSTLTGYLHSPDPINDTSKPKPKPNPNLDCKNIE